MRMIITLALAAALCACGSNSVTADNASVEEVAAKMKAAGFDKSMMRPGKWQSNVTIDSMDAPGMPPGVAAQIKKMSAATRTTESCLTPDQVKRPNPEMFAQAQKNCRYDHFEFGNGKMDMTMRCNAGAGGGTPGGQMQTIHMTGTYSGESSTMAMTSTSGTGAGGIGPMTMKMHIEGKRLGDCDK